MRSERRDDPRRRKQGEELVPRRRARQEVRVGVGQGGKGRAREGEERDRVEAEVGQSLQSRPRRGGFRLARAGAVAIWLELPCLRHSEPTLGGGGSNSRGG